MALKNTNKSTKTKGEEKVSLLDKMRTAWKNDTARFVIGLLLTLFAIYLLLAYASFFVTGAADQSIVEGSTAQELASADNGVHNYAGSRGAQVAQWLINDCFGISSLFLILFVGVSGLKLMRVWSTVRLWKWFISCTLLAVWFSIFLGFAFIDSYQDSFLYLGGLHGYNVSNWIVSQIGAPGLSLALLATAICFFIYLSARTIGMIRTALSFNYLKRKKKHAGEESEDAGEPDGASAEANAADEDDDAFIDPVEGKVPGEFTTSWEGEKQDNSISLTGEENFPHEELIPEEEERVAESHDFDFEVSQAPSVEMAEKTPEEESEPGFEVEAKKDEELVVLEPYNPRLDLEFYKFPTLDLMKHFDDVDPTVNMDELNARKDDIIKTLRSFGIEINSIKATVGPTVTLYEITPGEGVRISKIKNLEDDIALSLKALGVRIIAPIPGKGTIGIEVPNQKAKVVSGQSIIGSKLFQESTAELPIALGKTITNEVFMVDLAKMPHVLVAGATGQGKSVGLNAIITSLLYKKHPAELKFVLVDPKKVEFSIYSALEHHYLAKLPDGEDAVITDVTKVVQTLNSICVEMDTRYDLLKAAHVRNVKEYNELFKSRQLNPEKGHKFMPYIVVVIDEFGDLIMTAGKDVELPIARIAQLARAVGIHMIIATQRPTTNIITGTIKANFPARIAFRVMQMVDSRTILDRPGANQLIGKGDMLFLQGGDPVRVQCAFIDTPEVQNITKFISHQQGYPTAFFLPEYVDPNDAGSNLEGVDLEHKDPLFEDSARLIVVHQQGSTSLIQRKFSIGYNRAGRIMDQLEKAGIVGPAQGSKPREVYCVDETDLQMRLNNLG